MAVTYSPGKILSESVDSLNLAPDSSIEWFPQLGYAPDFPDVPAHVSSAAREAHAAASINANMAAIIMARTVVEATAKEKGITSGNLFVKIDELSAQDLIRSSTKDAAHEIRHFGNDMAHGDISELPTPQDVEEILALMGEVLNEVFQGPARTERIRNRRTDQ